MSSPSAQTPPTRSDGLEVWTLQHPTHGLIEVRAGFDPAFKAIHPDWPSEEKDRKKGTDQAQMLTAEDSLLQRAQGRLKNPQTRIEVLVDGAVQHRFDQLESARIALFSDEPIDKLRPMISIGVDRSKPHLKITASPFKEILQVDYREGNTVVEFDPPAGSRGAKRRDTMQSSEFRRTLIPIVEGLGKGGWALAVLILGPIIARILERLAKYLPDWELPDWTLPHLDLPVPDFPELSLPVPRIPFPDITLPQMPEWVELLAEYSKIWVPVVIGIAVGIIALRNHRKSEAQKAAWDAGETNTAEPTGEPTQQKPD